MELTFLGQCGIVIEEDRLRVAIDPVLTPLMDHGVDIRLYPSVMEPEELNADYVLCTHEHIDHMAIDTLKRIANATKKSIFVIPNGCVSLLASYGIDLSRIIGLADGETVLLTQERLKIGGISTAHPVHHVDENGMDCNLAYVIEIGHKRLIHLGDTYYTERLEKSLKANCPIDALFAPINGMDEEKAKIGLIGNMSAKEVAELVCQLEVGMVVPTHFDMVKGNTEDPLKLVNELKCRNNETKVWIPQLGFTLHEE